MMQLSTAGETVKYHQTKTSILELMEALQSSVILLVSLSVVRILQQMVQISHREAALASTKQT